MKKLTFSLIATVFMGVFATNAQSLPKNFLKIDIGLGRISSYTGECVNGGGMCPISLPSNSTDFAGGISKVSETVVSFAFSRTFYQENQQYLAAGLRIETQFSLPKSVTDKLGINDEFVVAKGNYQLEETDGFYYVSLPRVR